MSANKPFTQGQLDLMRRIEKTARSEDLRADVQAMREERQEVSPQRGQVVRGGRPIIGFKPNSN